MRTKPRILLIGNAFTPGYRGGSIRTLDHVTRRLGSDYDFFVYTRNHDYTDPSAYDLPVGPWIEVGQARVRYEQPWRRTPRRIAAVVDEVGADVVVVNSLFASGSIATLVARRLGLIRTPLVVAPEGELGSISRRQGRSRAKSGHLWITKRLGFYRSVVWRAASEQESHDISTFASAHDPVVVAASPPPPLAPMRASARPGHESVPGSARLLYLSAIDTRKGAVRSADLTLQTDGATLDLYGFVRDTSEMAALEARIVADGTDRVRFHGEVAHTETPALFETHDALVFPTGEEVLGYVVGEALLHGCPVFVSDRTPWQDLDQCGAGRVIALDDDDAWRRAIDALVTLPAEERRQQRRRARERGRRWCSDTSVDDAWRLLFDRARSGS